ncbi:hypothetical protein K469DRAFT_173763 [Zopfia rhizophila CBS 207.26]|uniref:Uncharacterized protein n=1 Tax=Zopfia rhizophila CBS 207.26 TaxID=1314779 RepID=A0A6A6DYL8_9PEZI|nr:hypothetical protein K469DRAFT_173763 [Zopfia rhizophila CBS 207.26]
MTPEQCSALDPNSLEFHLRSEGSKTQLFGWLVYTCLSWTLKACWLFFYPRPGEGVSHMTLKVDIAFALCAIIFVGTFCAILLKCQPISLNWQINPDPGNLC